MNKNLKLVYNSTPQQSQRQDSTREQLVDLLAFAIKLGMYDAADFIKKSLEA